jgi:hypothetical protein
MIAAHTPFSLMNWLKTRAGGASLLVVVACILSFIFFVWRAYVDPLSPQYDLDFAGAKWIEPAREAPHGYFRKAIFVATPPQQAWIQVAGTDSFELFVNGKTIDSESFVSTRVAGLYDLTSVLTTGKNVIAVNVSRDSYPGRAELLVRGAVRVGRDHWQEFLSDATWKAAIVPDGIPGGANWNATALDDAGWDNAHVVAPVDSRWPLQPVRLDPRVMQVPPQGRWISAPDAQAKEAAFICPVEIEHRGSETWLQVSATGGYELLVNGGLAAKRSSASRGLDVYRVTPWLRTGANTIVIRVRPDRGVVGLFVDGVSFQPLGRVQRFQTDDSWGVVSGPAEPNRDRAETAITLASYGDQPWGPLKKRFADVESYHLQDFVSVTKWIAGMALILGAGLLTWLIAPRIVAAVHGADAGRALAYDALLHAPLLVAMVLLLFLGADVRFHPDWPFHSLIVVLLVGWWLGMRALLWIHLSGNREAPATAEVEESPRHASLVTCGVLVAIALAGFYARASDIGFMSLDHDEVSMVKMARGILETGYPHAKIGSITKRLTTYELVPYPIAASALVFGWKDWAVRLPALVFGTLTIYFVGLAGTRMLGRRAGILAALILAFLPWSIQWSRNAFYPAQTQLFALMTFWFFYEALQTQPWSRRYLTLTTIFFCLTYLSWEGAGFILPALMILAVVMRPGDWSWLRHTHLWRCLGVTVLVVLLQQLHRMASGSSYLVVGSGLADLGLPQPYFLNPMYDPLFYVRSFLGLENLVALSLMGLVGLIFCWRRPGVRYAGGVVVTLIVLYTNLLGAYASRYALFYMPLLVLAAAGVCVAIGDGLSSCALWAGTRRWLSAAGTAKLGFAGLLFVASSGIGLDLYRLSSSPARPTERTRMGVYNIDYRGASRFVKEQVRPGDAVIPAVPHTYEFYTGSSGDFFVNTLMAQRVVYDAGLPVPRYTDRFGGNPVLRDLSEFQDAVLRKNRVWVIAAPYPIFAASNDRSLLDFLSQNARVVYESYEARVFLLQAGASPR